MEIIIGLYLLIIVVAVFASGKFVALAVKKGYSPSKAKKYPYMLGVAALFFNILGQTLFSFADRSMMALLFICWGSFVVLVLIAILIKAYKNMKVAPDAKQGNQSETNQKK